MERKDGIRGALLAWLLSCCCDDRLSRCCSSSSSSPRSCPINIITSGWLVLAPGEKDGWKKKKKRNHKLKVINVSPLGVTLLRCPQSFLPMPKLRLRFDFRVQRTRNMCHFHSFYLVVIIPRKKMKTIKLHNTTAAGRSFFLKHIIFGELNRNIVFFNDSKFATILFFPSPRYIDLIDQGRKKKEGKKIKKIKNKKSKNSAVQTRNIFFPPLLKFLLHIIDCYLPFKHTNSHTKEKNFFPIFFFLNFYW